MLEKDVWRDVIRAIEDILALYDHANELISLGQAQRARRYAIQRLGLLVLVIVRILPVPALLAFVTLPIGIRVMTIVLKDYGSDQKLMRALGLNVIVVLALPLLVSIGTAVGSFR